MDHEYDYVNDGAKFISQALDDYAEQVGAEVLEEFPKGVEAPKGSTETHRYFIIGRNQGINECRDVVKFKLLQKLKAMKGEV